MAAPPIAGLLFAIGGGGLALLAIAAVYALALLTVPGVALSTAANDARAAGTSLLREAMRGLRYVVTHRVLRGMAVSYTLYQASWGVLVIVVPLLILDQHDERAAAPIVGALWAAAGVAGGIGALAAGRLRVMHRERRVMALGIGATALGAGVLGLVPMLPGVAIGLVLIGLASGPVDVAPLSLRQRTTDPAWLGRVLAISIGLNTAGGPLGSALGGVLGGLSLEVAIAGAVLLALAGAAAALLAIPASRPQREA